MCAPASAIEAEKVEAGVRELERLGFRVRVADDILDKQIYAAGSPERRVRELHELFADPEVRGVVCARGGAGAAQVLPLLDLGLLAAHPKVFSGYSDITHLHSVLGNLGIVSFHGPMLATELSTGRYDADSFLQSVSAMDGGMAFGADAGLRVLREGRASGRLRGGCLTLLAAACGTPWSLRAEDDTILFLEEVDEKPYRVHRMLIQLRQSGVLDHVRGVVLGELPGCEGPPDLPYSLDEVLKDALPAPLPVAIGLRSGHRAASFLTLPLGVAAELAADAEGARLVLTEGTVS